MITITPTPQQFTAPPPLPNMSVPPPGHRYLTPQRFHGPPGRHTFFQPFRPYGRGGVAALDPEFDGKRLRKSAMRKTVDYNSAIIKMLESRVWQRDFRDRRCLQPDTMYIPDLQPPPSYEDNAINAVTTRFVKAATNKMRCPIFCMAWTPEGRRLVTGASSGEFTLWNGLTFNFETILQAHDSPVRTMVWSHNDVWMVTADHAGFVKYWQSNMNNVKMFLAHKEAIRGISFSPNDSKFATCSDDGTIRIWDFLRCQEERILRGHGADVKCVHWHPQKGLIISGSKDNQQPVKLWDPKTGQSLATLHAHKSTVMDIKWNNNGNWLITASRDHLLKLFDIRNLSSEVQTFRGHKKESSSVAWHPYHEGLFCSGGSDGAILFWHVGADKEVGAIEQAHDSIVWTLAWHPLGHILCSGSNDHSSKFWTRNRPGDQMRDKYNLNTLPSNIAGFEDNEIDDTSVIPGMGPEDKVETAVPAVGDPNVIPGLDIDSTEEKSKTILKKVPYSKPIPKNFQAQWNHSGAPGEAIDEKDGLDAMALLNQLIEKQPGATPLSEVEPESIFIFGKMIEVTPGSQLSDAIKGGAEALFRLINSGAIEELHDVMPHIDLRNDDDYEPESTEETEVEEEEPFNNQEDEDFRFKGVQDQDMRNFMQPPQQFMADMQLNSSLEQQRNMEARSLMDVDNRIPPNSDMFRPPNMDINKQDLFRQPLMQDMNRGAHNEMFRSQDLPRPNFNQDHQRQGPGRDLPRLSDFRMQNDDMRRFHGDSYGQDSMQRRRDHSPPNHRGNRFMGSENDDSYNQLGNDRDGRTFGNGEYHDDGRRWRDDNDEDWDDDLDDDVIERRDIDRDYDERRRYPPSRSKFPRGRGRGKPRGFDRNRRGGPSRGRGSPKGGRPFRSRGQRPGRKMKH